MKPMKCSYCSKYCYFPTIITVQCDRSFKKFRQDVWFGDSVIRLCTIRVTRCDITICSRRSWELLVISQWACTCIIYHKSCNDTCNITSDISSDFICDVTPRGLRINYIGHGAGVRTELSAGLWILWAAGWSSITELGRSGSQYNNFIKVPNCQ